MFKFSEKNTGREQFFSLTHAYTNTEGCEDAEIYEIAKICEKYWNPTWNSRWSKMMVAKEIPAEENLTKSLAEAVTCDNVKGKNHRWRCYKFSQKMTFYLL